MSRVLLQTIFPCCPALSPATKSAFRVDSCSTANAKSKACQVCSMLKVKKGRVCILATETTLCQPLLRLTPRHRHSTRGKRSAAIQRSETNLSGRQNGSWNHSLVLEQPLSRLSFHGHYSWL